MRDQMQHQMQHQIQGESQDARGVERTMQDSPSRPEMIPIITDSPPGPDAARGREVRAVVPDEAALQEATRALLDAGFDRAAIGVSGPGGNPAPGAAESPADEPDARQVRTLAASTASITAALLGGTVATVATGGAAAPVAGAAVVGAIGAGGAAHVGVQRAEDAREKRHDAEGAAGQLALSVSVRDDAQEETAREVLTALHPNGTRLD